MEANLDDIKTERINGAIVAQSAASIPHIEIQGRLFHSIYGFLKGKRCKVFSEARVVFDSSNWFQPDLAVICDRSKIKHTHIEGAPDFVAEILSPTTQFRDLGIKKDTYEKHGVKEYWIVNPGGKTVTTYLLKDGKYVMDNVYHKYSEEEWMWLTEEEKLKNSAPLKLSLYDDFEINMNEIFD